MRIQIGRPECGEAPYYCNGAPTRLEPRPISNGQAFYFGQRLIVQYTSDDTHHYVHIAPEFRRATDIERSDRSMDNDLVEHYTVRVGEEIVDQLLRTAQRGQEAAQLLNG